MSLDKKHLGSGRFIDANYDTLLKAERVNNTILTAADSFVIRNLSYILHGNYDFYTNLKRIKNRTLAQLKEFKGIPYFIEGTNGKVNQFCMSTGENMLISLLHILNVVIVRPAKSEDVRLILIDEIETHLHIELQKKILPFLTEFFPRIQFIVTTHSPYILNSISNSAVYDLENKIKVEDLSGYSAEGIVEGYFENDLYSDQAKLKLKRYRELLGKEKLSASERAERARLRDELQNIPAELAKEMKDAFEELEAERKLKIHD